MSESFEHYIASIEARAESECRHNLSKYNIFPEDVFSLDCEECPAKHECTVQQCGDAMTTEIIIGDCIKELKQFDDNSIDCILTSPPFKDEDVVGDYWTFYDGWFTEAVRVTSKVLIVIHSVTKMNEIISKYPPKRTLIWGKGMIQASFRYNPIFVYQKSEDYKVNKYIYSDTFGISPIIGRDKSHKYQDPDILYHAILKMFKNINIVCDPFAGSGTTGLACKKLGLDCILIEINQEYNSLINDRILSTTPEISTYV